MIYTWTNTQRELEALAPKILDYYKELANTENVTVTVGTLEVTLHLPPYWYYIENGRGPGKFPPLQAIENWIEVKHIVPREDYSVKTVSYLIARKIAREGTQGKHALEGTIDLIKNAFLTSLYFAIEKDIIENINRITDSKK